MIACGLKGNYEIVPNIVEPVTAETVERTDDKIRMMNIGDMWDDKKNISGLIKAVAAVSRNDPRFELHLFGDGRDREMLLSLARELAVLDKHVLYHGELPNKEVYEFMKTIDFYVTSSHVETFSIATAEAIACGKPVIATDCGGPSDFVIPEVGMLIPVDDQEALEQAILKMGSTFSNYRPDVLMKYAADRFSYDAVGEKLAAIYSRVLKRPLERERLGVVK